MTIARESDIRSMASVKGNIAIVKTRQPYIAGPELTPFARYIVE